MPVKPKKHIPPFSPSRREKNRIIDSTRPSSTARGYDRRWRKIRNKVLDAEPICRFCSDLGKVTPAEHVDHIDGDSRNNDSSNLRPLCASCHNARTARDQGFGRKHKG